MKEIIEVNADQLDLLMSMAIELSELNKEDENLTLLKKENRDNLLKYWKTRIKQI